MYRLHHALFTGTMHLFRFVGVREHGGESPTGREISAGGEEELRGLDRAVSELQEPEV